MLDQFCRHGVHLSMCHPVKDLPAHDCKYTDARDALIPKAAKYADEVSGKPLKMGGPSDYNAAWNRAFHSEMNRLARRIPE